MLLKSTPMILSKTLWMLMTFMTPVAMWCLMYKKTIIIEWTIMTTSSTQFTLPIILDQMGTMFCITVLFISANVMHFANTYMEDELDIKRFSYLVMAFVLSMNLLIFIPHMITLLIGWDGLGITSFLLVIYYQNPKSLAAGMITALTNRIGDVLILLTIALMINPGHWLIIHSLDSNFTKWIVMLIMVAAMTKSAQVPFSAWLPAAMAAPTPVSALVHSSTLVTGGIFLLIRFYPTLSQYNMFYIILLIMSTTTMFMAGLNALAECDMKKIIALSTLSQLGVMMSSIALSLPTLAFFHLVAHALFKALLFVCAGTLIHYHHHTQDLRSIGNVSAQMPLTIACLTAANLALCGLPFMAGFYSKDLIIEMLLFNPNNIIIIIMYFLATAMTAAYSIRLMMTAIWSPNMSLPIQTINDNDTNTTTPMMMLTMGAVMGGALINWTYILPSQEPFLPQYLKLAPLILTLTGAILAWKITTSLNSIWIHMPSHHSSNALMWFLAPLSSHNIMKPMLKINSQMLSNIDQGWLEILGPQGISKFTTRSFMYTSYPQTLTITSQLTLISILLVLLMIS